MGHAHAGKLRRPWRAVHTQVACSLLHVEIAQGRPFKGVQSMFQRRAVHVSKACSPCRIRPCRAAAMAAAAMARRYRSLNSWKREPKAGQLRRPWHAVHAAYVAAFVHAEYVNAARRRMHGVHVVTHDLLSHPNTLCSPPFLARQILHVR
jgi:hypothetical protein